jgi:hypothetical protein
MYNNDTRPSPRRVVRIELSAYTLLMRRDISSSSIVPSIAVCSPCLANPVPTDCHASPGWRLCAPAALPADDKNQSRYNTIASDDKHRAVNKGSRIESLAGSNPARPIEWIVRLCNPSCNNGAQIIGRFVHQYVPEEQQRYVSNSQCKLAMG